MSRRVRGERESAYPGGGVTVPPLFDSFLHLELDRAQGELPLQCVHIFRAHHWLAVANAQPHLLAQPRRRLLRNALVGTAQGARQELLPVPQVVHGGLLPGHAVAQGVGVVVQLVVDVIVLKQDGVEFPATTHKMTR